MSASSCIARSPFRLARCVHFAFCHSSLQCQSFSLHPTRAAFASPCSLCAPSRAAGLGGPRMDDGLLSGWALRLFRGKSLQEVQEIAYSRASRHRSIKAQRSLGQPDRYRDKRYQKSSSSQAGSSRCRGLFHKSYPSSIMARCRFN